MSIVRAAGVVLSLLTCAGVSGQSGFEVASIKPVPEQRGPQYDFSSSGPRVRYIAYSVATLIMEAYHVKRHQVTFAPGVEPPAGGAYNAFTVEAKAPGDRALSRDEFRPLLRALLEERFQLRLHRGQKEMPVYVLSVDKGGPKFKESAPDAVASAHIGVNGQNQSITGARQTADELAVMVENVYSLERPVVNRTGLNGFYDFRVEATPQFRMAREDPDLKNISIFTAVRQQLGLRLEPQNAAVEVLVVDAIEKPSAN